MEKSRLSYGLWGDKHLRHLTVSLERVLSRNRLRVQHHHHHPSHRRVKRNRNQLTFDALCFSRSGLIRMKVFFTNVSAFVISKVYWNNSTYFYRLSHIWDIEQ